MKIIATIEVRMSSSRLPGKVLRKIQEKPMLELLIERIKTCKSINEMVIATTVNPADDPIIELANRLNVKCYRGNEDDVLERVLKAAKFVNGDIIVELWGDSPLIDKEILEDLINHFLKNDVDCIGTTLPNFEKEFPIGFSAIIFPVKILGIQINN